MTKIGWTASLVLIISFCFLGTASAQANGGVKGKVRNMSGDGIAGATVTARMNGKDLRSVRSGKKGEFVIDGLEPGTYNVVFEAAGYSSGVKYGIEVVNGKTRDLGDRLILAVDRGSFVILNGSVYYKDGTSLEGAEIKVEHVNTDGSSKKLATLWTNESGEFALRQKPGAQKLRITASSGGKTSSKEIDVDTAAVYRLAITLDVARPKPQQL